MTIVWLFWGGLDKTHLGVEPKIGGKPPKWINMDGENNGKPY